MVEKSKFITEQQRLEAFAMFVLATQLYYRLRELERGIALSLKHNEEFVNHLSDAIYCEEGCSTQVFDRQLGYAGYVVKPKKRRSK